MICETREERERAAAVGTLRSRMIFAAGAARSLYAERETRAIARGRVSGCSSFYIPSRTSTFSEISLGRILQNKNLSRKEVESFRKIRLYNSHDEMSDKNWRKADENASI